MDHAPLPYELRDVAGAGYQIHATLPKGFQFSATCRTKDGLADGKAPFMLWALSEAMPVILASERWVQFETAAWKKMQKATGEFIVRACNSHDKLVAALQFMIERFGGIADQSDSVHDSAIVDDARRILAKSTTP